MYAGQIKVEPFTIAVDEDVLTDLRERIERTRWPDHIPGSGWDYGTDVDYLRTLLSNWAELDWRKQEEELNRLAHYRAEIETGCGSTSCTDAVADRSRCRSCSRPACRARSWSTSTCCRS